MALTREKKEEIIEDLKQKFTIQKAIVLVDFEGLDSKSLFKLRDELKELKCQFQVIKKTLFKKTLETLKEKSLAKKIGQIKGQLALAFGLEDEMSPSKICYQFSQKNENLRILGGILGNEFLEKEKIIEFAKLPSRAELLARLVGSLSAPISNLANVLQGNIKGLIYVLAKAKMNNE